MKKVILFFIICFTVTSCSVKEKPVFIAVENIKIVESNSKIIALRADALFNNPNDVKGKLSTEGIKVYVNDIEVATVSSEVFDVPAKKDFTIPLLVHVPTDSIISDKSLGGLIGSLFSKKVKVQYKGALNYKVFGFSHKYPVDKTEDVKLNF